MSRGEKFSNDKYLTKQQVAREMGSTLIENIWHEVITYRQNFTTQLTLRTVEKNRLRIVQTPKISDKINTVERRLTRVLGSINELKLITNQFVNFELKMVEKLLTSVATKYDVPLTTNFVSSLYHGDISAPSPHEFVLLNYYEALQITRETKNIPLDENLLIKIGEYFNDVSNLTYVYRQNEYKDPQQKALIGRVFIHVPINQIYDMINDMFGFMQISSASFFVKFSALLFFTSYIKPFDLYSEEIAVLLAKSYLAQNDFETFAYLLNFETLLARHREEAEEIMLEVKRTSDLTYFVNFLADVTEEILTETEKLIAELKVQVVRDEQHQITPSDQTPRSVLAEGEQISLFDDVTEQPVERPKRDPKEIIGYTTSEKAEPVHVPPTVIKPHEDLKIAVRKLPVQLSEEEASLLERHLLESDPSLSKIEATFYARHCTLGKYYTIAQFRDFIGCAYETARTSMDHLANSGYYDKQKLKNKFIYTPIERK